MPRTPLFRELAAGRLEGAAALVSRALKDDPAVAAEALAADVAFAIRRSGDVRGLAEAAELDGRLVGLLLATPEDGLAKDAAMIACWVVDPEAQGQGIGRSLLLRAVERCRERRLASLRARTLPSSPAAYRLFWRHGFRVIDVLPQTVAGREREVVLFEKRLGGTAAG